MSDEGKFVIMPRVRRHWSILLLFLMFAAPVFTGEQHLVLNERSLQQAERRYGQNGRHRLESWQALIDTGEHRDDQEKMEQVNRFFNQLQFVSDAIHWKQEDYWATPFEFLASGGGDCEDFAIAKFFTLTSLGVDENKLTLTYVKAQRLNQAHMILAYYSSPKAEPLILDNLMDTIELSSKRKDLVPVYSLNATGLWLAKQRGKGKLLGDTSRVKRWQDMLQRMAEELNQTEEKP